MARAVATMGSFSRISAAGFFHEPSGSAALDSSWRMDFTVRLEPPGSDAAREMPGAQ